MASAPDQLVDPAGSDLHVRLYIERHVVPYAERHIRLYTNIPPASYSQLRRLGPELQRLHTALLARHDTERLASRAEAMRRGA